MNVKYFFLLFLAFALLFGCYANVESSKSAEKLKTPSNESVPPVPPDDSGADDDIPPLPPD